MKREIDDYHESEGKCCRIAASVIKSPAILLDILRPKSQHGISSRREVDADVLNIKRKGNMIHIGSIELFVSWKYRVSMFSQRLERFCITIIRLPVQTNVSYRQIPAAHSCSLFGPLSGQPQCLQLLLVTRR